jgi:hypothetical protein
MKKIILILAVIITTTSCTKDEPIVEIPAKVVVTPPVAVVTPSVGTITEDIPFRYIRCTNHQYYNPSEYRNVWQVTVHFKSTFNRNIGGKIIIYYKENGVSKNITFTKRCDDTGSNMCHPVVLWDVEDLYSNNTFKLNIPRLEEHCHKTSMVLENVVFVRN